MGIFSKILAGGLGWTLGGPIGAIIGVSIASMFSSKSSSTTYSNTYDSRRVVRDQRSNDFKVALLVIFTAVMKADGVVTKRELAMVKQVLLKLYSESEALEALQVIKRLMNEDIDIDPVSVQCAQFMTYSARLELLHLLFNLAAADGEVHQRELSMILRIAQNMQIKQSDIASISAMFSKPVNSDWAYEVLALKPDCSDDDVKKAYRKMAMKYHPDKVNSLGEDVKKTATEKFRRIKDAYDEIKKQRNIA